MIYSLYREFRLSYRSKEEYKRYVAYRIQRAKYHRGFDRDEERIRYRLEKRRNKKISNNIDKLLE